MLTSARFFQASQFGEKNESNFLSTLSTNRQNIFTCRYVVKLVVCVIVNVSRTVLYVFQGPAAALFQKEYYELVSSALKPDGILCSEGKVY